MKVFEEFDIEDFDILFEKKNKHLSRNRRETKKVSFSQYVNVHLIPQKEELKEHFDLWLSENDFANSYKMAINELKRLLEIHPFMKLWEAKKLLYQPNNIRYDPNNFIDYS